MLGAKRGRIANRCLRTHQHWLFCFYIQLQRVTFYILCNIIWQQITCRLPISQVCMSEGRYQCLDPYLDACFLDGGWAHPCGRGHVCDGGWRGGHRAAPAPDARRDELPGQTGVCCPPLCVVPRLLFAFPPPKFWVASPAKFFSSFDVFIRYLRKLFFSFGRISATSSKSVQGKYSGVWRSLPHTLKTICCIHNLKSMFWIGTE